MSIRAPSSIPLVLIATGILVTSSIVNIVCSFCSYSLSHKLSLRSPCLPCTLYSSAGSRICSHRPEKKRQLIQGDALASSLDKQLQQERSSGGSQHVRHPHRDLNDTGRLVRLNLTEDSDVPGHNHVYHRPPAASSHCTRRSGPCAVVGHEAAAVGARGGGTKGRRSLLVKDVAAAAPGAGARRTKGGRGAPAASSPPFAAKERRDPPLVDVLAGWEVVVDQEAQPETLELPLRCLEGHVGQREDAGARPAASKEGGRPACASALPSLIVLLLLDDPCQQQNKKQRDSSEARGRTRNSYRKGGPAEAPIEALDASSHQLKGTKPSVEWIGSY